MKRRYPETTYWHLLAAYSDVLHRTAERQRHAELYPFKLPPQTIGVANEAKGEAA